MKLFGENLRKRAKELGLSDAEVARRAGLNERRYGFYVTGDREPDLQTLVRIADVLATPTDELLGREKGAELTARDKTLNQICSSVATLSDHDLRLVAIQVNALADEASVAKNRDHR